MKLEFYENIVNNSNEKDLIILYLKSQIKEKVDSLLEIGIGNYPIFHNQIGPQVLNYTAIDIINPKKQNKKIKFIQNDFEKHIFNQQFGVILASHVFYYLKEKDRSLKKRIKLLSNQGKAFIIVNEYTKDYKKYKDFFMELLNKKYTSTHEIFKKLLKNQKINYKEETITSSIKFKNTEDLYETLKLNFEENLSKYTKNMIKYRKYQSRDS